MPQAKFQTKKIWIWIQKNIQSLITLYKISRHQKQKAKKLIYIQSKRNIVQNLYHKNLLTPHTKNQGKLSEIQWLKYKMAK